jgi:hypothetical protein
MKLRQSKPNKGRGSQLGQYFFRQLFGDTALFKLRQHQETGDVKKRSLNVGNSPRRRTDDATLVSVQPHSIAITFDLEGAPPSPSDWGERLVVSAVHGEEGGEGDPPGHYVEVTPRALAMLNLRDCKEHLEGWKE